MTKTKTLNIGDPHAAVAASILAKPYYRVVVPEEDGTFRGEIFEFPGCIVTASTRNSALESLEDAAFSWICSSLALGQKIAEPMETRDYSGRLVLRLSHSLHKRAAIAAELDGISLNQFISSAILDTVSTKTTTRDITKYFMTMVPQFNIFGENFIVNSSISYHFNSAVKVTNGGKSVLGVPQRTHRDDIATL